VFHDSFTADAGWILCLYLGSTLALRTTERIPWARGRIFPALSLACLFNACLSYAVESTAMRMGWWQWNLSTQSSMLREVPMVGIIAWFSVGFDFLLPYYLIRHYRSKRQIWPYLSLLVFPFHMTSHLFGNRISTLVPVTPYNIWHWGMVLAVMLLPFLSHIRFGRPWARTEGRILRAVPAAGLGVVIGVLLVCDLAIVREPGLLIAKIPLFMYVGLSLGELPWAPVLLAGAAAAALGGRLFLTPLAVPLWWAALEGRALWARLPALRYVYLAVPLVLTGVFYHWNRERDAVDRLYAATVAEGLDAARGGDLRQAVQALEEAAALKPNSLPAYQHLGVLYSKLKRYDEAERAYRKVLQLRPLSEEARVNLGNVAFLRGDLDQAERWFAEALSIRPDMEYARKMLSHVRKLKKKSASGGESGPGH